MRLIARFAVEREKHLEVITVFDTQIQREILNFETPQIASIAMKFPAAIWFERKMHDDFGIKIIGAFDNRPLVHQEHFPKEIHPMRKSFDATQVDPCDYEPYRYEVVQGDGVFEVAVGPIHAGIIEPGHFQFSQAGEEMLHLEVRHFYTYRGIEKMVEGMTLMEAKPIIERISGNESIAYQVAWLAIAAQSSGVELPEGAQKAHAIFLELERIILHLTDLGFIANDAGFAAALSFTSQLSEEARRVMQVLTGHRFGFGAIGAHTVLANIQHLDDFLKQLSSKILWFKEWIYDIPSLWDRFDTTGRLVEEKAFKYGVVGVVARASGIGFDRRLESLLYRDHGFSCVTQMSGDVSARFKVRVDEIINSIEMIQNMRSQSEDTEVKLTQSLDGEFSTFVESALGELFMYIDLKEGKINRFYARDPSFVNWQALHCMMTSDIIADFPLINKSCDLSYAGSDL